MLQGAQQGSLCTPQNSVQLEPHHNYCCGAVQSHQKTWTPLNNSMRNHTTIFNWKLPSCKTLSNAPLRACCTQSAHAWWKSTFQGSWNLVLLGKENWSFSPWNAPSQRQMYFSSLWAHSTSTSTLTSSHHLHPNLRGLQLTLGGAAFPTQPLTYHCPVSPKWHMQPQCHHAGFQLAFLRFHSGPNLPRHSFH